MDLLIGAQMPDGGFNCESNQRVAVHCSLHSTISVLEAVRENLANGYTHRAAELDAIAQQAREFVLQHRLFRSDRTGEIINPSSDAVLSLALVYDILRALDYFRSAGVGYDPRMQDALDVLLQKRRKDGSWPLQAKHAGQVHFDMETPASQPLEHAVGVAGVETPWLPNRNLTNVGACLDGFRLYG